MINSHKCLFFSLLIISFPLFGKPLPSEKYLTASGIELMEAVYHRHKRYPYVYEEQAMILIDHKGNRETRQLRRFSRVEEDESVKLLLVFDQPDEVKGVAVLGHFDKSGDSEQFVFLPAHGPVLIKNTSSNLGGGFLGTDFSIENLLGENLTDFNYKRGRDIRLQGVEYFVVDAYKNRSDSASARLMHRHLILKENLYITQTDYFDGTGRLKKRQRQHDLTIVLGDMWRANMVLMEDFENHHQTLIKVNKRIFSPDYVRAEIFSAEWLIETYIDPPTAEEYEAGATEVEGVIES